MNPWSILSLIPGIFHVIFGIYVLIKQPKRYLNIVFFLFEMSLAIWSLSEFGHRATNNSQTAYVCIQISAIGWCFMNSLCAHFILLFSRHEKFLKNKLIYICLYLPPLIILYLFINTEIIFKHELVKMYYGYNLLPGDFIGIYTLYYMLLYFFAVYILNEVKKKGIILKKYQISSIFIGTTAFLVFTSLTNVILPGIGILSPELGTTFSIFWSVALSYAVLKHESLMINPLKESNLSKPQKYSLEKGKAYLIKENKPIRAYEIFYDQITHGYLGLCISKYDPEKVKQNYNIHNTSIIWLTFKSSENAVSPKDISSIISLISNFAKENENPIFILDCFDQIKFANGFNKSYQLLLELKNISIINKSILIISISPSMFSNSQVSAIQNVMEDII